jgi:hypothetical protein
MINVLLNSGFTYNYPGYKEGIKPKNTEGWMNLLTTYHPDCVLINQNKKAVFSLQGMLGFMLSQQFNLPQNEELIKSCSSIYIILIDNSKIVYYSNSGVLPNEKIINNFV